jgi:putative FmdB family regulatory protein
MPTYDYKCLDCGYSFEHFQRITEEPLKVCPKCSGNLKRLIGAGSGPIFKGSGFYHTDYKMKNKSSADKTGTKSSEVKNNSNQGKTDKK